MERLDLLLINPGNKTETYGELSSSLSAVEPPLWTALIAAFIRDKGFLTKIIDADAETWNPEYTAEKIIEYNPLLAGIGVIGPTPSASSTPKMVATSMILAALKKKAPNIKLILYGLHPSALPERTLIEQKSDFVCRGESFYTILKLLEALKSKDKIENFDIKGLWYIKNGGVISNGWGDLVQNLDKLPLAAWDLLPMNKYRAHNWHCFGRLNQRQPYGVIYTSLGCPFNCSYCNIHALYNGKPLIRYRSPKKVVEEIDLLVRDYDIKNIKIVDELFVINEGRVLELCDLIIQRGYRLNIWAYARIDTVNKKILKTMKKAGINWLCYGIESGTRRIRDGVIKGRFEDGAIKESIRMTLDAGIHVIGNYMFGLPDDDFKTMRKTLDMAMDLNCEYVNFYVTMAYPGSQLYTEAVEKGKELPRNWLGYSQLGKETFPLSTRYLASADVLRFRDTAFEKYYSNPRYLKMIKDKFGAETVEHINQMLKYKIHRTLSVNKHSYVRL